MDFDEQGQEFVFLKEDKDAMEQDPLPRLPDRLPVSYAPNLLRWADTKVELVFDRMNGALLLHGADVTKIQAECQETLSVLEKLKEQLLPHVLSIETEEFLRNYGN